MSIEGKSRKRNMADVPEHMVQLVERTKELSAHLIQIRTLGELDAAIFARSRLALVRYEAETQKKQPKIRQGYRVLP
jgi:hypothetical protein